MEEKEHPFVNTLNETAKTKHLINQLENELHDQDDAMDIDYTDEILLREEISTHWNAPRVLLSISGYPKITYYYYTKGIISSKIAHTNQPFIRYSHTRLSDLPIELHIMILQMLRFTELLKMESVCRYMYTTVHLVKKDLFLQKVWLRADWFELDLCGLWKYCVMNSEGITSITISGSDLKMLATNTLFLWRMKYVKKNATKEDIRKIRKKIPLSALRSIRWSDVRTLFQTLRYKTLNPYVSRIVVTGYWPSGHWSVVIVNSLSEGYIENIATLDFHYDRLQKIEIGRGYTSLWEVIIAGYVKAAILTCILFGRLDWITHSAEQAV